MSGRPAHPDFLDYEHIPAVDQHGMAVGVWRDGYQPRLWDPQNAKFGGDLHLCHVATHLVTDGLPADPDSEAWATQDRAISHHYECVGGVGSRGRYKKTWQHKDGCLISLLRLSRERYLEYGRY